MGFPSLLGCYSVGTKVSYLGCSVLGDPVRGVLGYPVTPYAWSPRSGVSFHDGVLSGRCNPWEVDLTPSPLGGIGDLGSRPTTKR